MDLGKLIGKGNTADVYEWGEDKVIKVFKSDYPLGAIQLEYDNSRRIRSYDFPIPKAHETVQIEDKVGIIYDRIWGETLLSWLFKTMDIEACATHMAKLHRRIFESRVGEVHDGFRSYKAFLKENIERCDNHKETLDKLNALPEGNFLCHGDFHPGNVFISDNELTVIDFMNVCQGHYLYDVARTVYLVEYTPVPSDLSDKKAIMAMKQKLGKVYLDVLAITIEEIQPFIDVIKVARMGECPDEFCGDTV